MVNNEFAVKAEITENGGGLDVDMMMAMYMPIEEPNEPCRRCGGKGQILGFMHVLGGICFSCWGHGIELTREERVAAGNIAKITLDVFRG